MTDLSQTIQKSTKPQTSEKNRTNLPELTQELPHLTRYALSLTRHREDAEDLVQDTILRALGSASQFRPDTRLRSWLFTILHNLFIDRCRAQKRRGMHVELSEWWPAVDRIEETTVADQQDNLHDVARTLAQLSPADQQIIQLAAVQNQGYEQLSRDLGIAMGTVKSRLNRARGRLKSMLATEIAPELLAA